MKKPGTVAKKPLLLDSQTVRTMELADAQLRGVAGGASSAGPIICKCSSGQIG